MLAVLRFSFDSRRAIICILLLGGLKYPPTLSVGMPNIEKLFPRNHFDTYTNKSVVQLNAERLF